MMLDLTHYHVHKKRQKAITDLFKNKATGGEGRETISVDGLEVHPVVVLTATAGIQTVNSKTFVLVK